MIAAGPPTPDPDRDERSPGVIRRVRVWLVIALAAVCGIVAGWLLTRAPGPPGPPADLEVAPFRCSGHCRRLDPSITLRWSAPTTGGEPIGYRIERNGTEIVGAGEQTTSETMFVDEKVTFGRRYEYRILAVGSAGASPPSLPITTRLPRPPVTSAQLNGVYAVHLKVRTAQALRSALGIEPPTPGATATDRWTFEPVCAAPQSACPTRWEGLDGLLVADDGTWSGTVAGPNARCGGGTSVAAPTRFDLDVVDARGEEDTWVVSSFEGLVTISFHCPGFLTSRGSIDVRGTRR